MSEAPKIYYGEEDELESGDEVPYSKLALISGISAVVIFAVLMMLSSIAATLAPLILMSAILFLALQLVYTGSLLLAGIRGDAAEKLEDQVSLQIFSYGIAVIAGLLFIADLLLRIF